LLAANNRSFGMNRD